MAQERILGWNEQGESKWHEGNHLPHGWHKQDPTIVSEPVQVDPKGTEYPAVEDNGPQDSQDQPEPASAPEEKAVEESKPEETEADKPVKKKLGRPRKGD